MPKGVTTSSTIFPLSVMIERRLYIVGASSDQRSGDDTVIFCSVSVLFFDETETGDSVLATSFPFASIITERSTASFETVFGLSIFVLMCTVAEAESACGVVIYVPRCATCKGLAMFSHT